TGARGYTGDGGAATSAKLYVPKGLGVDSNGNIYIADTTNNVIRKVDSSGTITTIAGIGDAEFSGNGGLALNAELNNPNSVAVAS
ncbi:SBBP repeat-containing protein, partial [Klebsiella pneumoniae]|uniref:NHL domain-containing protein n=1 Tax=Klebsiella pneumoniae TaxID=573 RepID=UPI0038531B48